MQGNVLYHVNNKYDIYDYVHSIVRFFGDNAILIPICRVPVPFGWTDTYRIFARVSFPIQSRVYVQEYRLASRPG